MSKPRAIPESLICSECGLDWDDHPKNATKSDCIELLHVELGRAKTTHNHCHHGHCNCYQWHWYTQQPAITWNDWNTYGSGTYTVSNASNTVVLDAPEDTTDLFRPVA